VGVTSDSRAVVEGGAFVALRGEAHDGHDYLTDAARRGAALVVVARGHGRPIPEGPACYLTDINVSYKRHVLGGIQDSWAERYSEATVHWALARKGVTLWQCPQIVVRQRREALPFWQALVERYCWGRLFGSVRARELSFFARLSYILLSPVLPLVLVLRILIKEIKARRPAGALLALPHLLSLTWAWCLGEFVGYLTKCEA